MAAAASYNTENIYRVAYLSFSSSGSNSATQQKKLFKQCLGDSDGNWNNNVGVENWDYGAWGDAAHTNMVGRFPHAIKLVKKNPTDSNDGGLHYLVWYDDTADSFNLLSTRPNYYDNLITGIDDSTEYYVFTTDGIAKAVMYDSKADGSYTSALDHQVLAYWKQYTNIIYTSFDVSCDSGNLNHTFMPGKASANVPNCISKGNLLYVTAGGYGNTRTTVDGDSYISRDIYDNRLDLGYTGMLYKVQKIWVEPRGPYTYLREDRYRIMVDKNINWDGYEAGNADGSGTYRNGYQWLFKFSPNDTTTYTYVSECSNRGLCDRTSGLCKCFKGYTNDNCDSQSALAI